MNSNPMKEAIRSLSHSLLESVRKFSKSVQGGDCYVAAYKFFNSNHTDGHGEMFLVHGLVSGQGKLEGIKYNHAWVEDDHIVYDYSNNRNIQLPKSLYYRIGEIQKGEVYKYNFDEVNKNSLKYKTYGPWEPKLLKHPY